jgi:hypothetical protein
MSVSDPEEIIGKKKRAPTSRGAVICGIFNTMLGVALGFATLSLTPATEYKAKPDAKTGQIPPPTSGIWYWAGTASGGFQEKEAQFLAAPSGELTLADGELNAWAEATFKSGLPKPKPAAAPASAGTAPVSEASKAKEEVKAAAEDLQNFGLAAGTPNFHVFQDPQAPASAPLTFQVALPFNVTILGMNFPTVYQARGTYQPGAQGPEFEPYYSVLGTARIPGPLAKMLFAHVMNSFAESPDAKKYTDAWAKFTSATAKDGALVLVAK